MPTDKIYEAIYSLQEYDFIFQQLISSCVINSAEIPTCSISFDKNLSKFVININVNWFESLNSTTQKFALIHEICHIIFHFFDRVGDRDLTKFNIAQDIVINHLIIDYCNINRNDIINWEKYCWIDTVSFISPPLPDQSADYYYDLIDMSNNNSSLFDEHIELSYEDLENLLQDMPVDTLNAIQEFKTQKNKFKSKQAGDSYIPDLIQQIIDNKTKSNVWNKIALILNQETDVDEDVWTRRNYRIANTKLTLPVYKDIDENRKPEVYIFLDCSGSCEDLRSTFIELVNSIPKNKFVVKKYAFTTRVIEIKDNRYPSTGGTCFECINDFVNSLKQHPKNIFVITDGQGNHINPKLPKRWHWILSESCTRYVPQKSHVYKLPDLNKIR